MKQELTTESSAENLASTEHPEEVGVGAEDSSVDVQGKEHTECTKFEVQ